MGPRRPKSAGSRSEASSSQQSRSTTLATISDPLTQPTVRFSETVPSSFEEGIQLPLGYDLADDIKSLFSYLSFCNTPDSIQLALPRILKAIRCSDYILYKARQALTLAPTPLTPPPPTFLIDCQGTYTSKVGITW